MGRLSTYTPGGLLYGTALSPRVLGLLVQEKILFFEAKPINHEKPNKNLKIPGIGVRGNPPCGESHDPVSTLGDDVPTCPRCS